MKSIQLFDDGHFSGFDVQGNFVTSAPGKTIWDSLKTLADGLKAPWMTEMDAYMQAADHFNVKITFREGKPATVRALANRTS